MKVDSTERRPARSFALTLLALTTFAVVPAEKSSPDAAPGWVATDLGKAGTTSSAVDVNEQGQVVGTMRSAGTGGASHAFHWADGKLRDLGTLPLGGGADMPNVSEAVAINDRGQIIGSSWVEQNDPLFSAVSWSAGKPRQLACPAWARMGRATAVNGRGQVVGWCGEGVPGQGLRSRAVLWQGGKRRDLGTLGGPSVAVAINEHRQIVGTSGDRAFLWQNGRLTDLGALRGADETYPVAINDRGQIVGTSGRHAFLWQNGRMTDLGSLRGNRFSEAVGINERGQVIGFSFASFDAYFAGAYRAFVWQSGRIRDLGTLGGRSSGAAAINDRGQIVGGSATRSGTGHAYIWEDGRMTDLGAASRAKSSFALAVNERGHVVGSSTMGDGKTHAMLWTPR